MALTTDLLHAPAANTDAVVTLSAKSTGRNISQIEWSYSATPDAGSHLKVENGAGTQVKKWFITAGGPGFMPLSGFAEGSDATDLIITLSAGGTGISGTVSVTP